MSGLYTKQKYSCLQKTVRMKRYFMQNVCFTWTYQKWNKEISPYNNMSNSNWSKFRKIIKLILLLITESHFIVNPKIYFEISPSILDIDYWIHSGYHMISNIQLDIIKWYWQTNALKTVSWCCLSLHKRNSMRKHFERNPNHLFLPKIRLPMFPLQ